ncbi:MAG: 2TM domain-containing protein [Hydrogenophaga sp.]|uniref:2TM domain-containing protein n=1 Tax=Hydrogenophaga crocea TaxID=2716225 RepID=A0A6G8ID78_9BURK|nr:MULTISPECIES: 2TM domain-containing protein [Hydrogenophaga]MBL0942849.1 2TM domain-containing protein [Hydrogenophaga sp.]QIM51144.1 2TM domain-containing protein [Hydrogenophaga crocea]
MNPLDHDLERTARRRVAARLGWTLHALVFLAVNAGLAWLSWRSGRDWAVFPAMGWGLGLLVHGLVVWVKLGGGGLHERWLAQERERLQQQRRA